jgi:flagellar P-ring protein precursor FlgI
VNARRWTISLLIAALWAQFVPIAGERWLGAATAFAQDAGGGGGGSGGGVGGGGGGGGELRVASDNLAVQDMARIAGQGSTILRGMGLVIGLSPKSGDSGRELALARPLAKVYEANGNPLPDLAELGAARSAALVAIEVEVPSQGAQLDDQFDIRVSTLHSATSLAGGRLILSPLSGPLPGQGVYAMGSGPIYIEDTQSPTQGVIRGGARIIQPIPMPAIRDRFTLTLLPAYRFHNIASRVADSINGALTDPAEGLVERSTGSEIARAIDDTSIVVTVPKEERGNVPQFVGLIMSTQVTLSLISQPAEVRVNPRTGSIIFAGNVEISPVAISHKNLTINTVNPSPPPSPANPLRLRERMIAIDTAGRRSDRAKIQDLLAAFRALDVPVEDRIDIILQLHRSGRLHARLIVE